MNPSQKYFLDGAALSVAWVHFLGFWKDNVGTIAATLSVIWLILQLGVFFKDKFAKKKKR